MTNFGASVLVVLARGLAVRGRGHVPNVPDRSGALPGLSTAPSDGDTRGAGFGHPTESSGAAGVS